MPLYVVIAAFCGFVFFALNGGLESREEKERRLRLAESTASITSYHCQESPRDEMCDGYREKAEAAHRNLVDFYRSHPK